MAECQQITLWGSRPTARRDIICKLALALAAAGFAVAPQAQSTTGGCLYSGASISAASASGSKRAIPFFPSASDSLGRQGFARLINRSSQMGEVSIVALDDEGNTHGSLTLLLGAKESAHFNSHDLENGNRKKGLTGGTGAGRGDWRLEITSDLDIDVLSYIRTSDGFVASMDDTVPWQDGGYRVALFNPGSNRNQKSLLRLANDGETSATVIITGRDDAGVPSAGAVTLEVPARSAKTYSAWELESGNSASLNGSLGDGRGKWQLAVRSEHMITAMNLLSSPNGYLANLSTRPGNETDGIHRVPFLPAASDPLRRQGFVRVINHSNAAGEVSIRAFDDAGREYDALTLSLGSNETKHFNSNDLESGKGH